MVILAVLPNMGTFFFIYLYKFIYTKSTYFRSIRKNYNGN